MRLEGKIAIVVGAGQSPAEGTRNGRATALRFASEGATVPALDRIYANVILPWVNGYADGGALARIGQTIPV